MRIILARSPAVIQYIEPHLIIDEDMTTKERFVAQLEDMLVREPDRTFVITVFDDKQEDAPLIGFMVAYAPMDSRKCFISQAWADPKAPKEMSGICFLRLVIWAQSREMTSLVMETKREPSAFQRRWGFVPSMVLMERKIGVEYETQLIQQIEKGTENGQQLTEDRKHMDRGAEASSLSTGFDLDDEFATGSRSDSVRGSDNSEPDPAMAEQPEPTGVVQSEPVADGTAGAEGVSWWQSVVSAEPKHDREVVSERGESTSVAVIPEGHSA